MPERLPHPGASYIREHQVRIGDRRLSAGMSRPQEGPDDWWLAVLWVADDEGVVSFREVGPDAGPPPEPPLHRLGPALAGNLSVGTGTKLGLSYKIAQGGFIQGKLDPNTADAGTVVMPDTTSPATSITGDVRGTYTPAGALNGTNNYHVTYVALGGPNNSDGYGVTQA